MASLQVLKAQPACILHSPRNSRCLITGIRANRHSPECSDLGMAQAYGTVGQCKYMLTRPYWNKYEHYATNGFTSLAMVIFTALFTFASHP
jgi:hypothetical protein